MSNIWSRLINFAGNLTGVVPLVNGGTNAANTAANGGIVWSDATKINITAAGTASQWVLSGGAATPTMSNTTTTGKFVDGSADEIQMRVQGNGTQTSNVLTVEKSDSTLLMNVTNTAGTAIKASTTNTAPASGVVGYYTTATWDTTSATSAQFNDVGSITLGVGIWRLSMNCYVLGATTFTSFQFFMGTTAGNNSTGFAYGLNGGVGGGLDATTKDVSGNIASYRVELSGSTTFYAKMKGVWTGTAEFVGAIIAEQVY